MRMASPASTVPISQRCTSMKDGRLEKNCATEPAVNAKMALKVKLTAMWVKPKMMDWKRVALIFLVTNADVVSF